MSQARRQRGRSTEHDVADYYREQGWLAALPVGAGRPGSDITGAPPSVHIEVKARAGFQPLAWLRQTGAIGRDPAASGVHAEGAPGLPGPSRLPWVVFRCNGQGPRSIEEWGVLMTVGDHTRLLRQAGYFPEV